MEIVLDDLLVSSPSTLQTAKQGRTPRLHLGVGVDKVLSGDGYGPDLLHNVTHTIFFVMEIVLDDLLVSSSSTLRTAKRTRTPGLPGGGGA